MTVQRAPGQRKCGWTSRVRPAGATKAYWWPHRALIPGGGISLCCEKMPSQRAGASWKDNSPSRKHKLSAWLSSFMGTKYMGPERPDLVCKESLNVVLRPADISKASRSLLSTAHSHNSWLPPIICGSFAGRTLRLWRRFHMGRHLMNRLDYKH